MMNKKVLTKELSMRMERLGLFSPDGDYSRHDLEYHISNLYTKRELESRLEKLLEENGLYK